MTLKRLSIFFAFFISFQFSFSQTNLVFIITDTTGHVLPYTNVVSLHENKGITSDKDGKVQLQLSENDTVLISNVGFIKQIWQVAQLISRDTIQLINDVKELQKVVVIDFNRFTKIKDVGFFNNNEPHTWQFLPGSQLAVYLKNPEQKSAWVKKVKIKIRGEGKCPINFRIRFLARDSLKDMPGADLLTENIIVPVEKQKRRTIINVSDYQVIFPADGFFVVLEWLKEDNACTAKMAEQVPGPATFGYFTTIASNFKNRDAPVFTNYLGRKWNRLYPVRHDTVLTPDIGIEVAY